MKAKLRNFALLVFLVLAVLFYLAKNFVMLAVDVAIILMVLWVLRSLAKRAFRRKA
ncbi:hypothetical protein STRATTON_7 [Erwinia phage vB_EamM_Stratton]|uniref:Uncharacterized protein n=2 Tax=Erskinevirus EaH2 TaxID=2169883 RepID=A0A1B2IGS8_9CAUD|nr:hypothetical protein G173_gp187 [Erwinia phage phiEaH2]AFQ96732.1 hypothetical protein [Erwinia phage phiEaH2]ANZ50442.1 hypothetical protein STRATTON_7 [Erwinia phage vB_EamM_Stratton]